MKKLSGFFVLVIMVVSMSCHKNHDAVQQSLKLKLNKIVDSFVANRLLPGVSLYVSTPCESLTLYAGYSNLESGTKWQPNVPGYAQSISKSLTATAVLQLMEKGKLRLDDPIKDYLERSIYEKIENGSTATIRQLLNHTSGIFDYLENPDFVNDVFSGNIFPYDYKKSLLYTYHQPSLFAPGTDWSYSNTNYTLLALIIDTVAGVSHGQYIKQNIIKRAGLKNTFYLPHEAVPVPVTNAYLFNDGTNVFDNVSITQYALTHGMIGDDGVVTTPDDLGRFYKKLFETFNLISEKSKKEMLDFITRDGKPKYGLGIMYRGSDRLGEAWGHSGAGLGAGAEAVYFPERKIMIVLMTNAGVILEGPSAEHFERLYKKVIGISTGIN